MRRIDVIIGIVGVVGLASVLTYEAYTYAWHRGFVAGRVTCPEVQQGERLRFVEQPFDERVAVCVYGRAYAVASVKREAR